MKHELDEVLLNCLSRLCADPFVHSWHAKERNWVNYFAHRFLWVHCKPGFVLFDPLQIGIEVPVAQPPGYRKQTVPRDLVIWPDLNPTCWVEGWRAERHPLAIIEWKVHRPQRRNRDVEDEREWLRKYCRWQRHVVAYAIEVNWAPGSLSVVASRFLSTKEQATWFQFSVSPNG